MGIAHFRNNGWRDTNRREYPWKEFQTIGFGQTDHNVSIENSHGLGRLAHSLYRWPASPASDPVSPSLALPWSTG